MFGFRSLDGCTGEYGGGSCREARDDAFERLLDARDALRRVDDRKPVRRLLRAPQVFVTRSREERFRFTLELVGRARRAAPLARGIGRHVEQHGQIRTEATLHPALERLE